MPIDRTGPLLDFLERNFRTPADAPITLDTPLLSDQILDSMGITLLAAFIEEQWGIPFDGTELRAGRLETVRAIAALLERLG
jgi:acyl carrier protein